jgi:archaellum component FlaC
VEKSSAWDLIEERVERVEERVERVEERVERVADVKSFICHPTTHNVRQSGPLI